ncbi:aspartyl/asparaginyl beta-hydroxylase domain-containing protein [Methylomonas montana]|uniref:aspartyl/asparaginyl beta-hydroxylase domain-containing protein n=1 Tax=Methylomonas montana TaxID=3058963 RepID=UPI00265A71E1|nr:aspartyl/asparaginyl beta-hydroxylase domain-containing protein [Methylomonas montana]WKJ88754.1 aspartyl/asparaginyl beta-hydroxylase domain-containing protein [Methylomonas montana]
MKNMFLLDQNVDVSQLAFELHTHPELWNADRERTSFSASPHRDCDDIWVRYNDKTPYVEKGDFSGFNDLHFPVWYPAYYQLPSLNALIWMLMGAVRGEHLGGILISRVKPGQKIHPHIDRSWHVDFYDKFNVCVKGAPGSAFIWTDDRETMPGRTGDIYHFTNSTTHEVVNESDQDFILLAICIRTHQFKDRYKR